MINYDRYNRITNEFIIFRLIFIFKIELSLVVYI
uniref:Uncharacterized protein n=1 Tax=Phyllymenia taiwanensis TaxID=1260292 RepID=R9XZC8_9FLOR|nr:hypothetical protein [Grateloupia taiwanensis]AGO19783.1 hypothetical protein [Grateloupia taiwanensis]